MSQRYRLRLARPAVTALAEGLPEKVAAAYEFITGPLLDQPHRVGKALVTDRDWALFAGRGVARPSRPPRQGEHPAYRLWPTARAQRGKYGRRFD